MFILFFKMSAMIKVFFFIFFNTILVAGDGKCAYRRCGKEEPEVHFPFTLEGHQDRSCGYPGFNLSCNGETNRTLIDLGPSGKFLVRAISYVTQEVQIYDQDNCLPRRLINLDLTDTPFTGTYKNFDFYNCAPDFSSNSLEPISCLSTSNHTVYAAPFFGSRAGFILDTCQIFATASVPLWEVYDGVVFLTDLNADLHLQWDEPNCGYCLVRGGTCKLKNRNKNETGCYNLPKRGLFKIAKYVLGVGLGVAALVFVLLILCYIYGRFKAIINGNRLRLTGLSSAEVLPEQPFSGVGLDESVIQSYPVVVFGESRRLIKLEDNICPICLSEYCASDILKSTPDCNHCFHAACIDQWLRRNITCPLCRNATMPILKPGPMPVSVPPSPPESQPV